MIPHEPGLSGNPTRQYLHNLVLHGIKLGLQNTQELLRALGNPQDQFLAVHIAGTNGKGSTAAFLASILRRAGYKTAQFTSPHLIDITERFIVDGQPMSDADLEDIVQRIKTVEQDMDPRPTFFEACTAIAFTHFAQQNVDIAIIETGMGGRLDSTNVLNPIATAITNISYDHTEFLGTTLTQIATEKAGILKPNTPAIIAENPPEALQTIHAIARKINAPVINTEGTYANITTGLENHFALHQENPVTLGLDGPCQAQNAATAAALAHTIQDQFPRLNTHHILNGLQDTHWPCRMQMVLQHPPAYIDVAHNQHGAEQIKLLGKSWTMLLAVSSNKDGLGILNALAPQAKHLILTQFQGSRALPTMELSRLATAYPHTTKPDIPQAIEHGLKIATPQAPLLIIGSLYTAGEAHAYLQEHYGIPPLQF